jgi:DNA-binding transcriptional MerR regulator
LHHWDELGLLTPSGRTAAGYRLYSDADVGRLYRVVALRGLGLSLEQVGAALEDGTELRGLVQRQLSELEERIELERRLRGRLVRVLGAPTSGELMADHRGDDHDREALHVRAASRARRAREQLGPEVMEKAQRDWPS